MMKMSYLFAYRTRVPEVTIFDARKGNDNGDSAFIYPWVEYLKTSEGKEFLDSIGVEKGIGNVTVRQGPDINKPKKNSNGWDQKVRVMLLLMICSYNIIHIIILTNLLVPCS